MADLIGQQVAEPCELIVTVTPHLVHETLLAVNHFIMREWQEEVFRENVHKAEGHQIKIVLTINRIFLVEAKDIIHPAHIPLVVKSKTTQLSHTSNLGF